MSSSGSVKLRYEICLLIWGNATELTQEDELDEATETKTPQHLQVKALADQAKQINQKKKKKKKQLVAKQAMQKAQEKMRQANTVQTV
jgi:hypothetical protein